LALVLHLLGHFDDGASHVLQDIGQFGGFANGFQKRPPGGRDVGGILGGSEGRKAFNLTTEPRCFCPPTPP
jgi:hypothetical protein